MKYAVIALSGTQYLVEEGQTISTTKLDIKEKEKSKTDQVLLVVDEDKVTIGKPIVEKAEVEFEVLKHYQGKKIHIFRYKGKSRYRKTQGFRGQLTDIKILKINN
jgi:large subunit ribosomal protein L21